MIVFNNLLAIVEVKRGKKKCTKCGLIMFHVCPKTIIEEWVVGNFGT
jgi:hypothetical protein